MAPTVSNPIRNPFGWSTRPGSRPVQEPARPEPHAAHDVGALGPEFACLPPVPARPRPGTAAWLEPPGEGATQPGKHREADAPWIASRGVDLSEVRAIFDRGRYWTEYQAIVDTRSGKTAGYEALGRFAGSDGSPISPAALFSLLHANPALLLQAELLLKFHQIEHAPTAPLFLNLDPDSWHRAGQGERNPFLGLFASAHTRLVVEVTESVVSAHALRVMDMVGSLRARGIAVALDDLGASDGLLSFDAVASAEVLKFDRALVSRLHDPRCRALVQALIRMSHDTGAYTILEGVERADDFVEARELGFDLVQGFLFRERTQVVRG